MFEITKKICNCQELFAVQAFIYIESETLKIGQTFF